MPINPEQLLAFWWNRRAVPVGNGLRPTKSLREKAVFRLAGYFVPIEPPGGGLSAVSHAVNDAGGNEQLFADWWVKHFTVDFEFDVPIHRHHNLIGRMSVIFPGLA